MKKVKDKNKKKMMGIAAALGLVTLLAGTFAWVAFEDQRINRVKTAAAGDTILVENWQDPGEIAPGMKAVKEVSVTNTGTAPTFVRVSYEEVIEYLKSKGIESSTAAGWTSASNDLPVSQGVSTVMNDTGALLTGFKEIPAANITGTTGLPTGTKFWAKGEIKLNSSTGNLQASFTGLVAFPYADPANPTETKYQKVVTEVKVDPSYALVAGTSIENWKFVNDKGDFMVYAGGTNRAAYDWTDKNTLLTTKGDKHGVAYDYEIANFSLPETAVNGAVIDRTPAVASMIPTASGHVRGVQADKTALGLTDSLFSITYGTDITDTTLLADNSWVYNGDDGFFYYTNPLQGGKSTPDLLKSLNYNQIDVAATEAEKEALKAAYIGLEYDLDVTMEAIQVEAEAITGSGSDWNMKQTGDSKLILNKLLLSASLPTIP